MLKPKRKCDAEELDRVKDRCMELIRKFVRDERSMTSEESLEWYRLTVYYERHRPRNAQMIAARKLKIRRSREIMKEDGHELMAKYGFKGLICSTDKP